ncbi:hypothetical protein [Telluribacter humicola]|uniref:hypothetical protein n=1 Tax=Telluribacter humicola TaxID=1720261 RepID=UPI001A96C504|nr:hypothetical protein [Telluribacter humicola]
MFTRGFFIVLLFQALVADQQSAITTNTAMSESKKWIVTTTGERDLDEVRQDLTKKGFKVEQVLDQIGCLTGSASEEVAHQLRSMPGIADVSPDADIQLPPADDPVTW